VYPARIRCVRLEQASQNARLRSSLKNSQFENFLLELNYDSKFFCPLVGI
jgi:hypothetical protein